MDQLQSPSQWRKVMRIGDAGIDVLAWRAVLELDGYDLSGQGQPSAFTTAVHNATVSWQKARGLGGDGIVGEKTRAAIGAPLVPAVTHRFNPSAIPFVEARYWQRDVGPQDKKLIVIHCMEYPETATSTEWCAAFFAGPDSPKSSAHYAVDSDSVVCMVQPELIAWHAPGANKHGIGIEHAGYARQSRAQWLDDYSLAMLMLSAQLSAHLCERFKIPARYVQGEQLRRGMPGITTHAEVSRTFELSTHWDPGPHFPMSDYLAWVNEALPPASRA